MKNIKVAMTVEELGLVTRLISDQLFRREFIDPKMPGYKGDPAELSMGKDLLQRMKSIVKETSGPSAGSVTRRTAGHAAANGFPDAV